ncbi:hypothetical protein [Devosia naphthalenivorans]|uniref:hypothetical protein n=1 Tax=Devosia naphthalenivorans TaxID=2082392 RepID=UPI000D3A640F|nr:hypothetical protein [Devosia naphthalenivorans]
MIAMTVPEVLQTYVQRGVFQDFRPAADKKMFDFVWLNYQRMRVQWQPAQQTIYFRDVIPNVAARSKMDQEIRAFLRGRTTADLPEHRRVDPDAFDLVCENRKSQMSVGIRLKTGTEEEGTRQLMAVMHETFIFLHQRWPEYMYESFGSPLE